MVEDPWLTFEVLGIVGLFLFGTRPRGVNAVAAAPCRLLQAVENDTPPNVMFGVDHLATSNTTKEKEAAFSDYDS